MAFFWLKRGHIKQVFCILFISGDKNNTIPVPTYSLWMYWIPDPFFSVIVTSDQSIKVEMTVGLYSIR